jgi:hypothetical protein
MCYQYEAADLNVKVQSVCTFNTLHIFIKIFSTISKYLHAAQRDGTNLIRASRDSCPHNIIEIVITVLSKV